MTAPLCIGWKEYVGLPEWGLRSVKAKMDTGACTSALDVLGYELAGRGTPKVRALLKLNLLRRHKRHTIEVEVPVLGMVVVRNSVGMCEERPLIETTLQLGPVRKQVRMTITDRSMMRFCMILGRSFLSGDFVVDVSRKYVYRKQAN